MQTTVPMIGLETPEIRWVRLLVSLLRHPDPNVPQLARHALLYIAESSSPVKRPGSVVAREGIPDSTPQK